jgi:phosphinothricin acetyltransferase
MENHTQIRVATEADLPAMLEIYNHIIVHTTAVWHYEPHTLTMRQEWFQQRQQQGHPVLVADIAGNIAGFSTYGPFRPWPGYKYTVENSVYVAESYRGRGVAKLLLSALIDCARKNQVHAIVAGIEAENSTSIALHEKFGFIEVAHFKEVGWKFDRWLDLKFLELLLAPAFQV